jgi:hypothetical protein
MPIIHITSHNGRCTPIKKVPFKTFYDGKVVEDDKNFVQLGSFDVIFLFNLISGIRCRVNDLSDKYAYHNIMTSHLMDIRQYYLEKFNKNLLADTLFQSFVPTCIGQGRDPVKETFRERKKKMMSGKPAIYKYVPGKNLEVPDFKFANTSGNPILKKNFKITKYILNPDLLKNENVINNEENDDNNDNIEE